MKNPTSSSATPQPVQHAATATIVTQHANQDDLFIDVDNNHKPHEPSTAFSLKHRKYWMGFSWTARQLYLNYLKILVLLRSNLISKNEPIDFEHLPSLESEQTIAGTLRIYETFLDALSHQEGKLRGEDVYKMIRSTFNMQFLAIHLFMVLEIACKITYSIVIQVILNNFARETYLDTDDNYQSTVLYTLLLFGLLFLSVNFRNKYGNILENNTILARQGLMILLYKKIGCLTQYQVQKANVGKLFGIMSGDLAQIEFLSQYAFTALWTPLLLAGTTVVICVRLGAFGLVGIGCVLLIYPAQQILGRHMHKCFVEKSGASDNKLKIVSEIIEGIRLIKLHGWEEAMGRRIDDARDKEQSSIFKVVLNRAIDRTVANVFVLVAAFLPILSIYYYGEEESGITLTSAKIFATLEQINGLKFSLILSGVGIGFLFQWKEMAKRFASFITVATVKSPSSTHNDNNAKTAVPLQEQNAIEIDADFTASWTEDQTDSNPTIKVKQSLAIRKGTFNALVGRIGSGKSTFLQFLIGEVPTLKGGLRVSSDSIAYVEQEPFIFSGKVTDNITFGRPMRRDWYNKVIDACCLADDFKILPAGDQTEIGERGITLSGGQRARIALARAVYSDSDIILLDDPLSAVDARVARSLVQNCLQGILKGKTIILATHQIPLISQCDSISIFEKGEIIAVGTYHELREELAIRSDSQTKSKDQKASSSSSPSDEIQLAADAQLAHNDDQNSVYNGTDDSNQDTSKGEVFSSEKEESVTVTFNSVIRYFKHSRYFSVLLLTVSMFAASEILFTYFYKIFGEFDLSDSRDNLFRNSGILLACYAFTTIAKYFSMALLTFLSNKHIHEEMTMKLLRAPVSFFERNPSGRLVNKFAGDINTMDFLIFFLFTDCTENPITFLNLIVTVTIYSPWFLLLAFGYAVILFSWLFYVKNLIVTSRSLDSVYKAPVISAFSESIAGTVILRVYKQIAYYAQKFETHCNNSISASVWIFNAVRVFQYYGQVLSSLVTFFGILICIYTSTDGTEFGQIVVYLTIIIELNNYLVGQMVSLNSNLNSAERLFKVCDIQPEGPLVLESDKETVKAYTQSQNAIEFKNVSLRYRKDIDLTLKNISFAIQKGEHIGCVGRTGAGKSSLLQALFRVVPIEANANSSILVNGIDASTLGLNTLRQSISIIPQTSFVFSGSIRKNIDPLGVYSDTAILKALETTGLLEAINSLEKKLDTEVTNTSSALSVGQKQLLCLTRALLSNHEILVLDEATANLDMQTDALIQKTIKTEFKGSSIFTVAHRLNTIADYHKVLVMDAGNIIEFDAPYRLLVNQIGETSITSNSVFAQLVKQTGQQNAANILEIARQTYYSLINSSNNNNINS